MFCLTATPGEGQDAQADRPDQPGITVPTEQDVSERERRPSSEDGAHKRAAAEPHNVPADQLRVQTKGLLDRITASQGNNETAIVGRFQLQTEYRDLHDNQAAWRNVARLDLPIGQKFIIRTDVPFYYAKFKPGDASNTWVSGLGDIFIRIGVLVYNSPGLKLFAGSDVIFPTANSDETGRDKYSVGPGIAISAPVPEWGMVLFWRFQQVVSVGGNPSTQDVDYTRLRFRFVKPLPNGWWVHAEPELRIDWTNGAKTAVLSEFEIGLKLDVHWRLFMRPAVGIWGDTVPGSYDWFIRIGVRYMF